MFFERVFEVDHSTINRWVLTYAPLIEKRLRRCRKPHCGSIRINETYVRVRGQWRHLYRAVDKCGNPVTSDNDKAPTHRLDGRSPAGHRIDCGAIWKNISRETGKPYLSLDIPSRNFKANLGQAAGQDDPAVKAIIPWN